jgi:hypothetical protein
MTAPTGRPRGRPRKRALTPPQSQSERQPSMSTTATAQVEKPAHAKHDTLTGLQARLKLQVVEKQAELASLDIEQTEARTALRRGIADLEAEVAEIETRLDGLQPAIGAEISAERYRSKVAEFTTAQALQDERCAAAAQIDDALAVIAAQYGRVKRLAREIHRLTGIGDDLVVEVRSHVRDEIIMALIPPGILAHDDIPAGYHGRINAYSNVLSCEQAAADLGNKIRDRWPVSPVRQIAEEAASQEMAEREIAATAERRRLNEIVAMAPYMLPASADPAPRQQLIHSATQPAMDIGLLQDGDQQ